MIVDKKLVTHVANLAHLELSDAETGYYETQLAKVLEHIEALAGMPDPLGEAWRGDVLGDGTPERRDAEQPSLAPEVALAGAPRKVGTAFQVPRIIE
jgi:aspartyl-tRNA(Asn)/glutamyl-tRNA(Gln) amidotransferase subunit C